MDDSANAESAEVTINAHDREVLMAELHALLASEWAELRRALPLMKLRHLQGNCSRSRKPLTATR